EPAADYSGFLDGSVFDSAVTAGCCACAVPCRVREGMNGVTSKGIFSRSEILPVGFALIISVGSLHGSGLIRVPSGSAAIVVDFFEASEGAVTFSIWALIGTWLPRCGLIRLGISLAREFNAWTNRAAFASWSLYGEFFNSSMPF